MTLKSPLPNRNHYLIAIGANGASDTVSNARLLRDAVLKVNRGDLCVVASSMCYRTPAFPKGAGPDFANACLVAESILEPVQVLERLHAIEAEMGRVRTKRWGQRVIDLDLIGAGDRVLPDAQTFAQWHDLPLEVQLERAPDQLILPHPRLQDRSFVLVPLAEIAPDWVHPILNKTVQQLKDALDPADLAQIKPI